jgi:hypothetical protein
MYSLPCPPFFAPTRAELRVVLVAGSSASTWARFLFFRHQWGSASRSAVPKSRQKTRSPSDKKKAEGHLRWHLSALGAYEMAGNEFEYVGKARQCVVFVLPVESARQGVKRGAEPIPNPGRIGAPGPLITGGPTHPRVRIRSADLFAFARCQ